MNKIGQEELYQIKQELQGIIQELESIASGLKSDFEGIGNDRCASKVSELAEHYRSVRGKLGSIDLSKAAEKDSQSHSS